MQQVQAQVHADTVKLMQMINNLQTTEENKILLRNLTGAHYHTASSTLHLAHFQQLRLPSPLSRVGTTVNTNYTNQQHYVGLRVYSWEEGMVHAVVNLAPFNRVLFVGGDAGFQVNLAAKDNVPMPFNGFDVGDVISQITKVTGLAACSCDRCVGASNLQGVVVQGKVHVQGGKERNFTGVTSICHAHCKHHRGIGRQKIQIGRGAQIFFME